MLIKKGVLSSMQLKDALEEHKLTKEFMGLILLRKHYIRKKDLLEALSEQFNIAFIDTRYQYIDWEFVKTFTASLIFDCKCFPLYKDKASVTFAITNPLDAWTISKIEKEIKDIELKIVLVSVENMGDLLERYSKLVKADIFNVSHKRDDI